MRTIQRKGALAGGKRTRWNDNDEDKDDDAGNQAHAHLDVLPPHLLADAVGAPTEALGRDSQVVGLILQSIKTLASLGDLVDVLTHHADGVVDLL